MKWFAILLTLSLSTAASAQIFGINIGGRDTYKNPSDALGYFRTGTCDAISEVFKDTPGRTYSWMAQSTAAPRDFLDALSTVVTPQCARKLAYDFAWVISKHGRLDRALNNRKYQAAERNLERLLRMGEVQTEGSDYLSEVRACIAQAERPVDPIRGIIGDVRNVTDDLRRTTRGRDACAPVTADAVKVVSGIQGEISNAYGIRRNAEGGYDILLNYSFTPARYSSSTEHVPTPAEMMARTRQCLAEASPFLRGPGGEQLTVKVLTGAELNALPVDQRPPEWNIAIIPEGQRGHSKAYTNKFMCPTITHETLHVMGLCDEYHETSQYMRGTCRVDDMPNTVMKYQEDAYEAATNRMVQCECDAICQEAQRHSRIARLYNAPSFRDVTSGFEAPLCVPANRDFFHEADLGTIPKLVIKNNTAGSITIQEAIVIPQAFPGAAVGFKRDWTCSCAGSSDENCHLHFNTLKQKVDRGLAGIQTRGCPQGETPISTSVIPTLPDNARDSVNGNVLTRYHEPTTPSLLAPAHFARIVNGLCVPSSSSNYVNCAAWAYVERPSDVTCRASAAPADKAYEPSEACLTQRAAETCTGRPAECSNPSHFLGLPQ